MPPVLRSHHHPQQPLMDPPHRPDEAPVPAPAPVPELDAPLPPAPDPEGRARDAVPVLNNAPRLPIVPQNDQLIDRLQCDLDMVLRILQIPPHPRPDPPPYAPRPFVGPATPPVVVPNPFPVVANPFPGNQMPHIRVERDLPHPPRAASADIPQRRHSPFVRPASAGVYHLNHPRHPTPPSRVLSPWSDDSNPALLPPAPVPLQNFDLSRAKIPTFNGMIQEDASSWIDDLRLLAVQHRLSDPNICTLFPLCLRGDETKRVFDSLTDDVKSDWALLQSAWLEAYPSMESRESQITILQDFRNLRVDERALCSESRDKDGHRVWELVKFSRKLAVAGHKVKGMTSGAKGREALSNLPSVIRNRLPVYNLTSEPSLEQLCKDLASADHHAIAAEVKEKLALSDSVSFLRREISHLSHPRSSSNLYSNSSSSSLPPPTKPNNPAPSRMLDPALPKSSPVFKNSPEGKALYKAAIDLWNRSHTPNAEPTVEDPYPLTPGSPSPGSGECWKCGSLQHRSYQSAACDPLEALPEKEQTYRRVVFEAIRSIQQQNRRRRFGPARPGTPSAQTSMNLFSQDNLLQHDWVSSDAINPDTPPSEVDMALFASPMVFGGGFGASGIYGGGFGNNDLSDMTAENS